MTIKQSQNEKAQIRTNKYCKFRKIKYQNGEFKKYIWSCIRINYHPINLTLYGIYELVIRSINKLNLIIVDIKNLNPIGYCLKITCHNGSYSKPI